MKKPSKLDGQVRWLERMVFGYCDPGSQRGVLLGISLRIRIYLYMGMVLFLVNSAGVIGHIIVNQPPENMLVFMRCCFCREAFH